MKWKSNENYVIMIITKKNKKNLTIFQVPNLSYYLELSSVFFSTSSSCYLSNRFRWMFLNKKKPVQEKPIFIFQSRFKVISSSTVQLLLDLLSLLGFEIIFLYFLSSLFYFEELLANIYRNLLQKDKYKLETFVLWVFHMNFLFFSGFFIFHFLRKILSKLWFFLKLFDSPFSVLHKFTTPVISLSIFISIHLISIHLICYWILFQHDCEWKKFNLSKWWQQAKVCGKLYDFFSLTITFVR